ncbi:MAG TPA: ROK family protein [Opitutaceae bacterium]|nr:ROK family protein [Opitutaceae bacterium]
MPHASLASDPRIVLTLDAGGSSFRFSARRGRERITEIITLPTHGDELPRCLAVLVEGFTRVRALCTEAPVAISFAFPGPADYRTGVIGDLTNLPAFRGGVALGPMLAAKFNLPVFINNDGDLFAYGEAMAGFLPWVNDQLAQAGSPRRFENLVGVTLGTGFGGGIVRRGELLGGDNSMAAEICMLRNKRDPQWNAEEGASIRAVRRAYAEAAGIAFADAPNPREIEEIAFGKRPGDAAAATESYRRLGEVVGDALAQTLTLVDGLAVIGGGLSAAGPLYLPALVAELNGTYATPSGGTRRRLVQQAFNLEEADQRAAFLRGATHEIEVPGTEQRIAYDPLARIGVGISRLGTSEAIALGAHVYALQQLDRA